MQVKVEETQVGHEESDIGGRQRIRGLWLNVCFERHGARNAIDVCNSGGGGGG